MNLASFCASPAKAILVWLIPRGSDSQRQRSCSGPSSSLTSNQLSFSLELQCPARPCQSPARAWHTEPPVSNTVRSTRSHVSLERVVSKMLAWLPSKALLVLLVSSQPPLSFIHSLPFPSRVGGGTRSVSSMGSSDQPSSWSLPRFPGFMSKTQWAAEGASGGWHAARERIFLRIKSRQKKTEPTDSGGQCTWAIGLTTVDPVCWRW